MLVVAASKFKLNWLTAAELQPINGAIELTIDLNARDFFEIDVPNLL